MSDEGLFQTSTAARLPDMDLIRDQEFDALNSRKPTVAHAVQSMGQEVCRAIGDVLNREGRRWTDLVDVSDANIPMLQGVGEALGSNAVGSSAWKEAKMQLLRLLDAS